MKINELLIENFIDEDVTESKDLMAVAHYLSQWMTSNIARKKYQGIKLTLKEIERKSGNPIPPIKSNHIKWLLFKPLTGATEWPLLFTFNDPHETEDNELGAFFPEPTHMININLDLILQKKKNLASTLLHELQHALDDYKSGGKSFHTQYYADHNKDMKAYLAHPMEINARFTQALWDLAANYETVARSDVYSSISKNLEKHKLRSTDFSNPKEYKRLISRAYKFLTDVSQIIDNKEKPGFIQTIKNLIRKWLP